MAMITRIDDYFANGCGRCERFATADCSTRRWAAGLAELRRICLSAGLDERVKWGHPCYMHAGRNLAIVGAHRGDFRLSFFDAALLQDPAQVLRKQGPNTKHADAIVFTDVATPQRMQAVILAYLREAMSLAERGVRAPKQQEVLALPIELVEAMDADSQLAEAFRALTPGRQRSYVIAIASAKQRATRVARIARFRPKILAGKGAMER